MMDQTQAPPTDRMKRLAETLRSNGLAASDTQALEMARNMCQTDEKVMKQADTNRSSMIKNYDINKPASTERQKQDANQPWEKEEIAQEHPAPQGQGPAPSNLALDEAISNVQQQFKQPEPEQPVQQAPPTAEPAPQEQLPAPQEQPVPQQAPPTAEPAPQAPQEQPAPQGQPEPAPQAPQSRNPELPDDLPIAQAASEPAAGVVENPLPSQPQQSPSEPVAPQQAPPTAEPAPQAPQGQPEPAAQAQPEPAPQAAQGQPEPSPQPQQAPQDRAPERDVSKYAESKIQLSDVFNVNK